MSLAFLFFVRAKETDMPKLEERILVPVDFSDHSRAALERAVQLARARDARIDLLHAIAYPPVADDPDCAARLRPEIRRASEEALERLAATLRDRGIDYETRLVERDPADAIRSAALTPGTSLIVMGSHGRRGLDRLLLGSVAERTLTGSPLPVYVTRESLAEAPDPIRSILLATDFSRDAQRVEVQVASLAREAQAEVEVLHAVWEPSALFAPYAVAGGADIETELLEAARQRIDRVAERLGEHGVEAKTKIVVGRAPESILDRAEATGAQLIAMGTRGYSTLQRFIMGSVTHRVLRHAPCSVLVSCGGRDEH